MEMDHIVIFDRESGLGVDIDYIIRDGRMHTVVDRLYEGDL